MFKCGSLTICATAFLLSCGNPAIAHAPLKLPLPPVHFAHVPINAIHAELEYALLHSSKATLLPATHLLSIPVSPVHAPLANVHTMPAAEVINHSVAASSHVLAIHSELDLSEYAEIEREKLRSIAVLLADSEKLHLSGDFITRDKIAEHARQILFTLPRKTILQLGHDAQFLKLHALRYLFRLDS